MRLDRYPNNLHLTTTEVKKRVVYIILGSLYYDDYVSTSFEPLNINLTLKKKFLEKRGENFLC